MRRWFEQLATFSHAAWKTRRWATCLWPGLGPLWFDGSWRGLAGAMAYAAALNGLLAVSLVWYELASPAVKGVGWLFVAGVWLASAAVSWRWLARRDGQNQRQSRPTATEDLYPTAVNEYLKRNFVAAERHLLKLVAANQRDCEAGLLLAAVWRRTGRAGEAREELMRLALLEAAQPWAMEIERELKLLDGVDRGAERGADRSTNDALAEDEARAEDTDQTQAA